VVVDPRRTETAAIASEYVAIKPGTDLWFLLGLLTALRDAGPPRTAAYADRLAEFDGALAATAGVTLAEAADRCGVAGPVIGRLAGEIHGARRACLYGRMGVSTQEHGTLCQWLLQLIHLYTGNLDSVGGILPCEPAMPVTGPGTSRGHRARFASRVRSLPEFGGELPASALAEELATPGAGQIRGLLTCAGNPVLSVPGGAQIDELLAGLEYFVAIDIYVNETTRHANLILPPASPLTQYHYDIVFNAFAIRRIARLNVPLRDRAPDERGDWEIIDGLCRAHAAATGTAHSPLPPPRALIAQRLAQGPDRLSVDDLEAAPHGIDLGPLAPSLLRRLQTEDGRIACAPAFLVDALANARSVPKRVAEDGELLLIGRRHVRSNNSWMHRSEERVGKECT
jgi:anaerobic selenocysteine-containing dehydrogenase